MFDAGPVGRAFFIAWLFLPALVVVLGIALLDRRPAARVRRFWCDTAGQVVDVTFVANAARACTAFAPVSAITCGRACENSGDGRRRVA